MADPVIYRDYEIVVEAFQHRVGRHKGTWGSSFYLKKIGGPPVPAIMAASSERNAEAALGKAYRRAKTIIDDREAYKATADSPIGVATFVGSPNARAQLQEN